MGGIGDFLFGGDPEIEYTQSPWERKVFEGVSPFLERMRSDQMVRSLMPLGPTEEWYNRLSPNIMAGIKAPYLDAFSTLTEGMNARGQLGGALMSPAAGAFAGEFAAKMGEGIGQQAWRMHQPVMAQQQAAAMLPYQLMPQMLGLSMGQTVVQPGKKGFMDYLGPIGMGAMGLGALGFSPFGG